MNEPVISTNRIELDTPAKQSIFGRMVGMSQQSVSKHIEKGHLTKGGTYRQWLYQYARRLRMQSINYNPSEELFNHVEEFSLPGEVPVSLSRSIAQELAESTGLKIDPKKLHNILQSNLSTPIHEQQKPSKDQR